MAWFLALQGSPNRMGQAPTYELHESANVAQIEQEMTSSATLDRAVAIPAVFHNRRQVTLYVRPAAWGAWLFFELTEQERREMAAANPVVSALAQAAKQQKSRKSQGPAGPSVLPRLDQNHD
ncbi:hypothetical protein [Mycobacterium sp.]|uniref:hypothetical protein n=1 Tax=Mycobacterium sp. TaxID=1785 RepID=UPI0012775843|nr:hypothetical protein [Mycobacterium sp.]KAA8962747.1 MAG: hypothetical protein F6Q13_11725 [Mycobacterium sp.]